MPIHNYWINQSKQSVSLGNTSDHPKCTKKYSRAEYNAFSMCYTTSENLVQLPPC